MTIDPEHIGGFADLLEAGSLVQPHRLRVAGKHLEIDPFEQFVRLDPLLRVLDEPLAEADLAMIPIDAHAKQATMPGEALGMGPEINVPDDPVARIAGDPQAAPTGLANRQCKPGTKGGRSLRREAGLAPGQRLEVRVAVLAIVGKMIIQVEQELIEFLRGDWNDHGGSDWLHERSRGTWRWGWACVPARQLNANIVPNITWDPLDNSSSPRKRGSSDFKLLKE